MGIERDGTDRLLCSPLLLQRSAFGILALGLELGMDVAVGDWAEIAKVTT